MTSTSVVTTHADPGRAIASAWSTSSSIAWARARRSAAVSTGIRRCLAFTRSFTGTATNALTGPLGSFERLEGATGERHLVVRARHDGGRRDGRDAFRVDGRRVPSVLL